MIAEASAVVYVTFERHLTRGASVIAWSSRSLWGQAGLIRRNRRVRSPWPQPGRMLGGSTLPCKQPLTTPRRPSLRPLRSRAGAFLFFEVPMELSPDDVSNFFVDADGLVEVTGAYLEDIDGALVLSATNSSRSCTSSHSSRRSSPSSRSRTFPRSFSA